MILLFPVLLLAGCPREAPSDTTETISPAECASAPQVSWEGWAHGFMVTYCRSCHSADSPNRHGAPIGVDFDTEAQARANAAAIERSVLTDATMPVGGGIVEEDRELLRVWLGCGG